MDTFISPQNRERIRQKVDSGKYGSPDEVIDVALKLLNERDAQLDKLRGRIWRQIGVRDVASIQSSEFLEAYTPERIAEFLLNNAIDEEDYQRAREEVEKLNLDPDLIPHERPDS